MSTQSNPLVSVVIPLYNCKEFIAETLRSVMDQTYSNIEIVVVDDGSKDCSPEIAQDMLRDWGGRYVFFSQQNAGGCTARNKGIELSHGDYIQFLDNDDALRPEKIQRQIDYLRQYDFSDSVLAMGEWVGIEDGTPRMQDGLKHDYEMPVDLMVDLFLGHCCIYPNTFLTPKRLVLSAGPWNQQMARDDDGEFFSRVYAKAKKIVYTPEAIAMYRFGNPDSLSKVEKPQLIEGMVHSSLAKCEILRTRSAHPLAKEAMFEELTCHLRLYYPYFSECRKRTESFISKFIPEKMVVHPHCSIKTWIYYYMVKFGWLRSNLIP